MIAGDFTADIAIKGLRGEGGGLQNNIFPETGLIIEPSSRPGD